MADKHGIATVLNSLEQSLSPVPHEVNEMDWKVSLSEHKERLAEHLMAFANYANRAIYNQTLVKVFRLTRPVAQVIDEPTRGADRARPVPFCTFMCEYTQACGKKSVHQAV